MADLDVIAVLTAKPGSEALVGAALHELVVATRREEPDACLAYDLYESAAAPGTFLTVERWRSQEDLDAHLQTAHVGAALAAAGEHLDGAPAIHPLTPVAP